MASEGDIADDLISGSLKRSKSYHRDYGRKTYGEIKRLAKRKPPDKKARQPDRELAAIAGQGIGEAEAMKTIASFKRSLAEIRLLMARRKHADALAQVDALLSQWENQPALLILRGELIQLQDQEGPPLDAAAASLKRAAALDDRNADAWLELGHFQFAVEDDAKAAEKSFAAAIAASSESLIAALVGRAGTLEEMGRTRDAFDCLSVARYLQGATPTKNGSAEDEASLFDRWESIVGNA